MSKLFIVSNRLPVNAKIRAGRVLLTPSAGGLATGLRGVVSREHATWIGWPGLTTEEIGKHRPQLERALRHRRLSPVFLAQEEYEQFYLGCSNRIIWPLFHYFTQYAEYRTDYWEMYRKINERFARAITRLAKNGDTIWIHDYHLMLVPALIRQRLPDSQIGFFLHIPFPAFEVFRQLPWAREITTGLLGADVVGFHRYGYVRHFLEAALRFYGYEAEFGKIARGRRITHVDSFSLGIDYPRFDQTARSQAVAKRSRAIRQEMRGQKILLSVDRMDYTKGILEHLAAYRELLRRHPDYRGRLTYFMVCVPSRTDVEEYQTLKEAVQESIASINGDFGSIKWAPIKYFYRSLPFKELVSLYRCADVAVVSPLRDGMNLVAKEYVASQVDRRGALVLSELAGTAQEFGEAIEVNPNDIPSVAEAIHTTLKMPRAERRQRLATMQDRLRQYDVHRWANEFLRTLADVQQEQAALQRRSVTPKLRRSLLRAYRRGKQRLLILDYDGTLVPFASTPEKAAPDRELRQLLQTLADDPKNTVVIISGRQRQFLHRWFGKLPLDLIAEHGVWFRRHGYKWRTVGQINTDWKQSVRRFMQFAVDRTPATFIEEKSHSLAWHYRQADTKLARQRLRELKQHLLEHTAHEDLTVLDGNKVLEVKNASVNKGRTVQRWLERANWDFIFAVGDDVTDEDMFDVMPESAISCKVGAGASAARYTIDEPADVRALLKIFSAAAPR